MTTSVEQTTFNHIVKHLKDQGRPSYKPNSGCKYRHTTEDGATLQCAIGACLKDEPYEIQCLEGEDVYSIDPDLFLPEFKGCDIDLMVELQMAHDSCAQSPEFFKELVPKLIRAAQDYDLILPAELM